MFRFSLCFALMAFFWPMVVSASALTPPPTIVSLSKNSGWSEFRFDLNFRNGIWLDSSADPKTQPLAPLEFHFSLDEKTTLQVSDAYRWGDIFSVFANGQLLGKTSDPATGDYNGDDYFNDYDAAYSDVNWSSGSWDLTPGDYIITGNINKMPELRGRGALRLIDFNGTADWDPNQERTQYETTPVPLPGSLSLMLGAGAIAFTVSIRRSNARKG